MSRFYFCPNSKLFKALLVVTSSLSLVQAATTYYMSGCQVTMGAYMFNLEDLKRTDTADGDYVVSYDNGLGTVYIDYNICDYTMSTCSDSGSDYANLVNENNTCYHISTSDINDVAITFIDEEVPGLGVSMVYGGASLCNDTDYYTLTVQVNCNSYSDSTTYEFDTDSVSTPCSPRVIMQSSAGCPTFSIGTLYQFFQTYYYIFGVLMMLLGLFLLTVGGKFYQVTMFMAGTFAVSAFLMLVLYIDIYPTYSPMWLVWMTLICSIGFGSGVGYAAQRWARIGVLLIGTWCGGIFGMVLYVLFIHYFVTDNQTLAVWITTATSALITSILSMVFFDHACIIGSGLGGSYALIRGISEYAGGYPNEFLIFEAFKYNTLDELEVSFYIYITVFIAVAVVSIVIQMKFRQTHMEQYNYRKYDFKYRRAPLN